MKLEKRNNAFRNIIFGIMLKIYQMIMPFIMRTIIIYFLGAEFLGLNSLFNSILQVLNLAELGVGSAMVYAMYKPIVEDDNKKLCALLNLYKKYYRIIGTVILVVGFILTPFLPMLISDSLPESVNLYVLYFLNLSATVLTYWLFAYKNSLLQAYQRTDVASKVLMLTDTIKYLLQIIALAFLKNYYFYCIALLGSQIANNIITAYFAQKKYPDIVAKGDIDKNEKKIINGKIKDLFTTKIATTLLSSGDTLVISSFLGLVALAIYQNYFYIISALLGCFTIIHTAVTAGIGNSLLLESKEKVQETFDMMLFGIIWILTLCSAGLICVMQIFMKVWVGSDLMLDNLIVYLLILYMWIYELTQFFSVYKEAAGIWHQDRFRPLICSVINVIMNVVLVNKLGVYGVVFATIISSGMVSLPWVVHNVFKYVFKDKAIKCLMKFSKYFIGAFSICVGLAIITPKVHMNSDVLEFLVKGILSVVIMNLIWLLMFRKTNEFYHLKEMCSSLIHRTRRKGSN